MICLYLAYDLYKLTRDYHAAVMLCLCGLGELMCSYVVIQGVLKWLG